MVARDQPIYIKLSERRGSRFNRDLYRLFSRLGEKVDFIVWPAVFLHENGPLLEKGIAQPMTN